MFKTKDIFGNPIELKATTWNEHILVNHPEMKDELKEIQSTVETPSLVYSSASSDERRVFFDQHSTSKYPQLYVKVVADYTEEVVTVTTAMFSKKIDGVKGDGLLYAKRKV